MFATSNTQNSVKREKYGCDDDEDFVENSDEDFVENSDDMQLDLEYAEKKTIGSSGNNSAINYKNPKTEYLNQSGLKIGHKINNKYDQPDEGGTNKTNGNYFNKPSTRQPDESGTKKTNGDYRTNKPSTKQPVNTNHHKTMANDITCFGKNEKLKAELLEIKLSAEMLIKREKDKREERRKQIENEDSEEVRN